jgi:4-amino-4-deoxy-L-arabinose transferase-like glycosyltransferase
MGDSEGYFTLGRAIAQGQPYQYGPQAAQIFRAPGYPLLLAPVFWLAGPDYALPAARAENALWGALAVAGVWWLARQWFGPRAALLAGCMAAVYPESVVSSVLVLSDTSFCALMLLHLGLWTAASKSESSRRAILLAAAGGLAAGAATLVRPGWLPFTPLVAIIAVGWVKVAQIVGGARKPDKRISARWRVATDKSATEAPPKSRFARPTLHVSESSTLYEPAVSRRRQAAVGAVMLAAMAVVMSPWWIRNARLTGHFVPATLQVGASLFDGLNPAATGAGDMTPGTQYAADYRRREPPAAGESPAEVEYRTDRRLGQAALDWAWAHPAAALRLAGIKLLRTWNVWPNEGRFSTPLVRLVVAASYLPLLALGLLGAWRTRRWGWPYWLGWFPAVYFSALHVVFVGSIRYRQPAMFCLMALAAGVIAHTEGRRPSSPG